MAPVVQAETMNKLREFLKSEYQKRKVIYPSTQNYFRAFHHTPFERVKVVILGQDPYHGPGQAHGLCFSVPEGQAFPPSLQNIFKELRDDLGMSIPSKGDLTPWADRGVLLLNTVLTVEQNRPASHAQQGWEYFTDGVIRLLSEKKEFLVFVLWGAHAQKKKVLIDLQKHKIIESPHPSPLSAHRGFLGSKPFSKINRLLQDAGLAPIDWKLN